jgi:hypothetical protein
MLGVAIDAAALDVTSCGTTIAANEIGVLQGDLVCSDPFGVRLERGARLDLNGHSITTTDVDARAVYCSTRRCSVVSSTPTPGVLDGGWVSRYALHAAGTFDFSENDVAVTRVTVDNVQFRRAAFAGVFATEAKVKISRSRFEDCYAGVVAEKIQASDIHATGGAYGFEATKRIKGQEVTIIGPWRYGVGGNDARVDMTGLTVTACGDYGITAASVRLGESQLSNNGQADIVSARLPRLRDTACERSTMQTLGGTWGVCSLD